MSVIFYCIAIFIIYLAIILLALYYFIKHRAIWESVFGLDTIMELVVCPEHFIFPIPGIIFEETNCVKVTNEKLYTKTIIKQYLDTCLSKLGIISDSNKINNNKEYRKELKMIKWLVNGIVKDYNLLFDGRYDILDKLIKSYEHFQEVEDNLGLEELDLDQEGIEVIENNIDICNELLELDKELELNRYLDILLDSNYKSSNNTCNNTFIIDLISRVRNIIKKIKLYNLISL